MARVLTRVSRGLVLFVAWSFFLLSILGVLVTAALLARPNNSGASVEVMGLPYHGRPGALLALGEAFVVFAFLLLSRSHQTARRRIGHVVLVAWVSLFLGNAWYHFDLGNNVMLAAFGTIAISWLGVVLRAAWYWTPPPVGAQSPRIR